MTPFSGYERKNCHSTNRFLIFVLQAVPSPMRLQCSHWRLVIQEPFLRFISRICIRPIATRPPPLSHKLSIDSGWLLGFNSSHRQSCFTVPHDYHFFPRSSPALLGFVSGCVSRTSLVNWSGITTPIASLGAA